MSVYQAVTYDTKICVLAPSQCLGGETQPGEWPIPFSFLKLQILM